MICKETEIREGFTFSGTHTSEYGLRLIERVGNPPTEKEIYENIPFMQGEYDFSDVLGVRVFNNRELTYVFEQIEYDYQSRKVDETVLSNWLLRSRRQELYDDYDKGYYYIAKCKTVESVDNYHGTQYKITFDAQPFMIGELEEGNDIWDTFNFELDVAQDTKYTVNGTEVITIINGGSNLVQPTIQASNPMTVIKGSKTYSIPEGQSKSYEFNLDVGENKLTIQGNGTIEFLFYKELI